MIIPHLRYLKLTLCFVLLLLPSIEASVDLDYTLYAQLVRDNVLDENHTPQSMLNYMQLNGATASNYSEYLFFADTERERLKDLVKEMFQFGYDSYMTHAFPLDELDPIHCRGRGPDNDTANINVNDALGDYMLTLVDSLTTLIVMGNATEFQHAAQLVIERLNFDTDTTVQIFEATIRVMGGLLSAHLVAINSEQPFGNMTIPNYKNELLVLANELGVRLLSAFENLECDLPHPRVNLKYGVPNDSYSYSCTSGAGSLLLEFGMLSKLVNDPVYEAVARKATQAIYSKRNNQTGLFGNQFNIHTGDWVNDMSGLGAGIDSFIEYLLKGYILFGDSKDYDMYEETAASIRLYLRRGREQCLAGIGHHPIYVNVDMRNGNVINNWIDALQASYPGVQVLDGDLSEAICFHAFYFAIWKKFGVLPERFNWNLKLPDVYFYPLRPEFAEATYFLYQSTRSPFYLHVAKMIIENINEISKVKCGFATVHDVLDKSLEDRQESFFLSETLKYLYLIFDKENFLNGKGSMEYIFSTEGHLFPTNYHKLTSFGNKSQRSNVAKAPSDSKNARHAQCHLKMPSDAFYNLRHSLPMSMRYFDQLFEMVGVNDNLEKLLERKST